MTFAEYNTDDYFNNKDSTADGLIKAAYDEGKTREEVEKSLSPLWKEDKKGNVKKALDTYYKIEEPKAEEKTAPKVEEMTQTTEALKPEEEKKPSLENENTGIKRSDKTYLDEVNAILNEEQKQELQKLSKTSVDSYNRTMENMQKQGDAFKSIDDKLIDQLPTFMWRRYQNGEFGDPKSSDAKLRLAYFAMNNVVSKLKTIANADAIARGQGQIFGNTESAYDQYQASNLAKGLENRWNKYNQETQSAIDLVKHRGIENEEALNIVNKISMNNRLQTAYNMADANKKAYMIEVLSKVGDKVSNWNDTKFVNALVGAEMTGEDVGNAAALIGTRAGEKILDNFNLIDENGNLDLSVLKNIKDLPGIKEAFAEKGIDIDKFDFDTAGVASLPVSGGKVTIPGSEKLNSPVIGGKTYEGDTSREGSFWGGKLDDKTMAKYSALQSKKPDGIKTDLMSDEEIKTFLDNNPNMKGGDVLKKSGINTKITKQAKELKSALDQAEKDYKKDKDLDTYKKRVNEINDYFTELEGITKDFGYANFLLNYEGIHKTAKKVNKMK